MIYIDIGNTLLKAVKKTGADWTEIFCVPVNSQVKISNWVKSLHPDSQAIATTVRTDIRNLISNHDNRKQIEWIDNKMISGFEMDYKTPKTLGVDRFLSCLGACAVTGKDVVVIDAGSACTIDMMSADRTYRGGVIMPGLGMLHRAMETGTPELPGIDYDIPAAFPGKSTSECLQWGINGSFVHSVRAFLNQYAKKCGSCKIFVTGGDAEWIHMQLNKEFQLKIRKNLVFDGMEEFYRMREKI